MTRTRIYRVPNLTHEFNFKVRNILEAYYGIKLILFFDLKINKQAIEKIETVLPVEVIEIFGEKFKKSYGKFCRLNATCGESILEIGGIEIYSKESKDWIKWFTETENGKYFDDVELYVEYLKRVDSFWAETLINLK